MTDFLLQRGDVIMAVTAVGSVVLGSWLLVLDAAVLGSFCMAAALVAVFAAGYLRYLKRAGRL
jgi:hypothetical protein